MDMESRFSELKRYVRFGDADASLLAELRPVAAPHFTRIAREFYERTREHEDAHAVFTGEAQIERLQRSLVQWLDRLLSGNYGEDYFVRTFAIGQVHVRVGLPQRYMVTGMALVRDALEAIVDEAPGLDARRMRGAISRVLDLELAVMLEGYRDNLERRAERRSELEARDHADTLMAADRFESAVNAGPLVVVGVDSKGAVQLFNDAATRLTGLASEEAIGTAFVETLVAPDLRERDRHVVDALLRGEPGRIQLESLLATRAGRLRDVRWTFERPTSPRGGIALFAYGEDVTDARALSERIHRRDKLATVETLASGLAHEIRNPLNGARLHLVLLERAAKKAGADAEVLEAAAVVNAEIARLSQLVSEFTELARPQPLQRLAGDVRRVVEATYHRFVPRAAAAGVETDLDLPAQELFSDIDVPRLERAIDNVLDNALDALSSRSGGKITLRSRRTPRHVVVEIEDDGPGIPDGARVFDPFYSTKSNGTGLGLAVAHRIITDHEGTIAVESRRGRTCFRFTLPTKRSMEGSDGDST